MYANVIIFGKSGVAENELSYSIPDVLEKECAAGAFVKAPFKDKTANGVIVSVQEKPPSAIAEEKIKPISEILPGFKLSHKQIDLARFVSDYYRCSLGRVMRLFIPARIRNAKKYIKIQDFPQFSPEHILKEPEKVLTDGQAEALSKINTSGKPVLLHGVTGSGKTEIYLRLILETIKKGGQAMLLVPEIALTPQMIMYFREYLGDRIAIFHSGMTEAKRLTEWRKAEAGFSPLIIGSRSAIFAPVLSPGIIILDEEHEWTYKQESAPYYQTHIVAEEMRRIYGARLIFGSATPKAESFEKAERGEWLYVNLNGRILKTDMPHIHIADMREEFKKKNFSIFSLILQNKIKERLIKNEQVILFVNQRGTAGAVVCRECGHAESVRIVISALNYISLKSQVSSLKSQVSSLKFQVSSYRNN